MSYKEGGWQQKYQIKKIVTLHGPERDGETKQIVIDPDPNAVYFVLRLDTDPHARNAAFAYARSVQSENPQFAKDIRDKVLGLFEKNVTKKGSENSDA